MSKKPGRNDPCPCGSGKKYKRCCLARDEAAAREDAREQASFSSDNLFDDVALDDSDDLYDDEGEPFTLDVNAIISVCYTRGFVGELSDLESGGDLRVTEWKAPQIPQLVLDCIGLEPLGELEGEWGDSTAANPIQVDVIDVETETDIIGIEVFNRAIGPVQDEAHDMQRLDRICSVLEACSSSGASERSADLLDAALPPVPVFRREERSAAVQEEVDWAQVLKEHRKLGGTCALCHQTVTRGRARAHLEKCAPAHDARGGAEQRLVHVRATVAGLPAYWLDVEAKAGARLEALDSFLRAIWLECCGHLSMFKIGDVQYHSRGYDLGFGRAFPGLGRARPVERSMAARLGDVLPAPGQRFHYEYDFGTTTSLQLATMGERTGRPGRSPVRLLVRNTAPVWPCAICGQPATLVCSYCLGEDWNAFTCAKHRRRHRCGEGEGLLPLVNSPRTGVCGYTGDG